jgi:hypothetical protein
LVPKIVGINDSIKTKAEYCFLMLINEFKTTKKEFENKENDYDDIRLYKGWGLRVLSEKQGITLSSRLAVGNTKKKLSFLMECEDLVPKTEINITPWIV